MLFLLHQCMCGVFFFFFYNEFFPSIEISEHHLLLLNRRISLILIQDINMPCVKTDNVREFGDGENAELETVFVLADFKSPDYSYLYRNDNRIVGPPVLLHCAQRKEVCYFSAMFLPWIIWWFWVWWWETRYKEIIYKNVISCLSFPSPWCSPHVRYFLPPWWIWRCASLASAGKKKS